MKSKRPLNISSLKDTEDNLFSALGVNVMWWPLPDKIVRKALKKKHVTFYLLSDDGKTNIAGYIALNKIKAYKDKDAHFECYCHARKNHINAALFMASELKGRSHLIDSSLLAIQSLRNDPKSQPVNFVEHEDGLVTHPFTALVIGFGETGRDALRFLYEYGCFIKSVIEKGIDKDIEADIITEQEKHIHVVDEKLSLLKADFLAGAHTLSDDSSIEWLDRSTHSEEFTARLNNIIKDLNYVVIAVKDDDEAISIAVRICKLARIKCHLRDGKKLGIFVRLREKNNYELLAHLKDTNESISIHPFGKNGKIFNYENITTETVEEQAKRFYFEYSKKSAEIEDNIERMEELSVSSPEREWQRRRCNAFSIENEVQDRPVSLCLRKARSIDLFYKEEQDRSNAYHIYTKRILAGSYMSLSDEDKARLIDILGYCEHVRWNAKMKLMNFEPYVEDREIEALTKNSQKKLAQTGRYQHACILSCNDLIRGKQKDTFKYDKRIAEFSIQQAY